VEERKNRPFRLSGVFLEGTVEKEQMGNIQTKYWRRILASSAVYAAAGWAAVEALTTVVERFGLPDWPATLVTALYVTGLPVTVFLVWRTAGEERRLNLPSFLGAMTFLIVGTGAIFWMTRPSPAPPINIVAIVPCEFSGEDSFAYRAEGVAEDVHARLSRVDSVKLFQPVRARSRLRATGDRRYAQRRSAY
jgi:hypothetical protein